MSIKFSQELTQYFPKKHFKYESFKGQQLQGIDNKRLQYMQNFLPKAQTRISKPNFKIRNLDQGTIQEHCKCKSIVNKDHSILISSYHFHRHWLLSIAVTLLQAAGTYFQIEGRSYIYKFAKLNHFLCKRYHT